jgi:hypothetical protein
LKKKILVFFLKQASKTVPFCLKLGFFDLEFTVPDEEDNAKGGDNETQNREQEGPTCENESDEEEEDEEEEEEEDKEEEREFNFMLSFGSSNDHADLSFISSSNVL